MLSSSRAALATGLRGLSGLAGPASSGRAQQAVAGYAAAAGGGDAGAAASEPQEEGALDELAQRVTPSKKAAMLKVLSTPRRKLKPQGGVAELLAPGNSISDPAYSVKDPVYFRDAANAK
ncbi:hypothetical protein Rsub_11630 [Raphidocelis subcapitata]|uniref:Uncharacterized protein n=1 Tax=Raphidocelis subcapitata TaxID=307507 RepID=A0A2V0PPR6_9CHLO|nr:hypothetical protein Rsub_11630 [Raphidocelis subcapitata]|eukprot:GBF99185.1 hypothetical protein Rsub_11630 [Raphidocelis subcapitata]